MTSSILPASGRFVLIHLFSPQSVSMWWAGLVPLFTFGNRGTERLSTRPKITQL